VIYIHSVFRLATGSKPSPKRFLHIMRSRASSFKREYPLLSLKSSSSILRLRDIHWRKVRTCIYHIHYLLIISVCFWRKSRQWAKVSSFTRFLDDPQRRTIVITTLLDEWSARRRDFYRTIHTQNSQQTNIHAPGGIRTHNLSRRAAADLHLRQRGHWDRLLVISRNIKSVM